MKVLVVAAHPDDEVLGCGGTIAKLSDQGHHVDIIIMAEGETSRANNVISQDQQSKLSDLKKAAEVAGDILGAASVTLLSFPDNRMDSLDLLSVVQVLEKEIADTRYDAVYTHHAGDVNVDHQVVHQAVITAFRPIPDKCRASIYTFEVASSTEWQTPSALIPFLPSVFVDISSTLGRKLKALSVYDMEMRSWPHARSIKAVNAQAQWRGATVGVEAAEAFAACRIIL